MEAFLGNCDATIEKFNNVLILSCGRRVELVKAFKAAQANANCGGKIVAVDISTSAPALYFADKFYIIPRIGDSEFISTIIKICKNDNIKLIVPTIDTELLPLAISKQKIEEETDARVLVSDFTTIDICRDKTKSAKFFQANNIAVPKTLSVDDIENHHYSFPLFIKPKDGSSSIGAFKLINQKELDFFVDYIKNPIVQECATGTEYTIDVFSDFDSNVITIVPRKRIATRGGEILKGQIEKNKIIIEDVKKLLSILKTIGHITIQGFLGNDNIFRYIEINPRFGGGAPMSFMAGANSPENLFKLLRGEMLEYNENYRDGIILSRFDACIEIKE